MQDTAVPKRRDNLPQSELSGSPPESVSIAEIGADDDVQPRAGGLDHAYVAELAAHYQAGDELPPVTLFRCPVSGAHWCADGFHRLAAAAQAGVDALPAVILPGGKEAAMRHAMQANAAHGRRRTAADLSRCYRRAVAEQWIQPHDTDAVAKLLNCSERWASEITREARNQANAERDATIHRLAAEGENQRYIASRVGVSPGTVNNVLSVQKRKTSETEQSDVEPSAAILSIDEDDGQELDAPTASAEPPACIVKATAKTQFLKTHRSHAAHLRKVAAQIYSECSEYSRTPPAEVLRQLDDLRETADKLSRSIAKLIGEPRGGDESAEVKP